MNRRRTRCVGCGRACSLTDDRGRGVTCGCSALARSGSVRRSQRNGLRERAYASALDALYPSLNEWVFYGSRDAKSALLSDYDTLPQAQRSAWDAAVERAFVAHHGDDRARMYRRLKGEAAGETSGLSVTTDDVTGAARFVAVYDVSSSDVLSHHAQDDTPLASRGFGHEHEVVLKSHNDARLVRVVKNW